MNEEKDIMNRFDTIALQALGLSLALVAGCNRPDGGASSSTTATSGAFASQPPKAAASPASDTKDVALASAIAQGSAPSGAPAAAAAAPGGFVGSCTDKESFLCNAWTGALPLGSEDSCKVMNGVFSKTDRCPTDKLGKSALAGICTIKNESDERVKMAHSYHVDGTTLKASAESAKAMCDVQNGTFVAAAAPAAGVPAKPKKKK